MTWQQQGEHDEWVFGEMVRGVVRRPLAEIYFVDDDDSNGGWVWFLSKDRTTISPPCRGRETSFRRAVEAAERAMVISGHDMPATG